MRAALITGANKSIGLEAARQLLQRGYHVYLGSRSLNAGASAVDQLVTDGLTEVEAVQLDVTDPDSVRAARAEIGNKTDVLDVLINNAGVNGGMPQTALGADLAAYRDVFEVNVFGVVRVTQAFIDLLRRSPAPRIVNVSSSQASLTLHSDPTWKFYNNKGAIYHPSKAALNMYTIDLAYELRDTAFRVNAVDPGFTSTDFNHHRGTGTVQDAGTRVVKYALESELPNGGFFSEEHNPETGELPW